MLTIGQEIIFNYTGGVQDITLSPGKYTFTVYGASGGGGGGVMLHSSSKTPSIGGPGGKAEATFNIYSETTVYAYVGGKGYYGEDEGLTSGPSYGGWNGGGNNNANIGGSGGGATDFRLINGSWNNLESLYSRFIVAGGGGGSDDRGGYYGSSNDGSGGYGGGINGEGAYVSGQLKDNFRGTQNSGNALGKGQDSQSSSDAGGGGGGWYGGLSSNDMNGGGGGGSGYIKGYPNCNTDYLSYQTSVEYVNGYFENGVNVGHGYAKVKCNVLFEDIITCFRFWTQDLSLDSYSFISKEYETINYAQQSIYESKINFHKKAITGFTISDNLQKHIFMHIISNGHVESVYSNGSSSNSGSVIVLNLIPQMSGTVKFYSDNKTLGDPYGYITGYISRTNDDGNDNNNFLIEDSIIKNQNYYFRCGSYANKRSTYDWHVEITYNDYKDEIKDIEEPLTNNFCVIDFYYTRNSYALTVKNGSSDKYTYLFEEIGNLYFNNIVSNPLKKFGYWFNDQYQDNLISCHLKNANFMMPASNMTVSVKFIDQDRVNTNIYKNIFEQFVFDLFDLQNRLVNDPYERISNIFQINHGFELYDVIKITENGLYKKAIATEEDYDAIGIVSEIINENEFIITTHGHIYYEFVSVSDSTVLYLSDSEPGKLVTYEDITTEFYTPIGFINGDKIMINIMDSSVGNTLKKYQEQLFNQELTYLSQEDIIEIYNEVYNS